MNTIDTQRYPIGKFDWGSPLSPSGRAANIEIIDRLPSDLRAVLAGMSPEQLDTPYREGGWTVRQLVHHVADSHMNSYVRYRLALTENQPTIKPYDEKLWAELPDAKAAPLEDSLQLIDALHRRWTALLRALRDEDFARTFRHPERGLMTLDQNTALYAWHGRHHVAHITGLRERMGW